MEARSSIATFVQFMEGEVFEREYYIAHTTLKRFPWGTVFLIVLGFLFFILPGLVLLAYFAMRRLSVSHGYAAVTNRRVLYYEYNDHPAESYQHMRSLHVEDVTGMNFRVERTVFKKSFSMALYTEKKGIYVGASGFVDLLKGFGNVKRLEPGPDSLEFIQVMSGLVAARKFGRPGSSSAPRP